jgi:hypothetical protein
MTPREDNGREQSGDPTVIGILLAGVLASFVIPGPFDWGSSLIGVVLLCVLVGYGDYPRDRRAAIGGAAAAAFTLLLILSRPLDTVLDLTNWPEGETLDSYKPSRDGGLQLAALWVVLFSILLWLWAPLKRVIERNEDCSRRSARQH